MVNITSGDSSELNNKALERMLGEGTRYRSVNTVVNQVQSDPLAYPEQQEQHLYYSIIMTSQRLCNGTR